MGCLCILTSAVSEIYRGEGLTDERDIVHRSLLTIRTVATDSSLLLGQPPKLVVVPPMRQVRCTRFTLPSRKAKLSSARGGEGS
jgi:hypothetical protein